MTSKKTRIGYKIVSVRNGRYYSWKVHPEPVEYRIGKTTKPKPGFGPLCLFSTLEEAKAHLVKNSGNVILKVRYVPAPESRVWTPEVISGLDILQDKTVLAKSITPIKVIE